MSGALVEACTIAELKALSMPTPCGGRMAKAKRPPYIDRYASEPVYRIIQRIADRNRGPVRRAILSAIADTLGETRGRDFTAALASRTIEDVLRAVPWDDVAVPKLQENLTERLGQIASESGEATNRFIPREVKLNLDLLNEKAVQWAATRSAELITVVGNETKAAIRTMVAEAFQEGIPARTLGRLIRPLIGLNERQAKAVVTFGLNLMAEGVSVAETDERMERYAQRSLRFRAEMIARTETMRAANRGQELNWESAVEEGLIDRTQLVREWITTPDDRLCPLCEPQDGLRAKIGEPFALRQPAEGLADTPNEIHPMCRCAEGLVEA